MSALPPPARPDEVAGVLRTVWPNLPVLLVGSVPVAMAWVAVRAVPPAFGWLTLLGVGLGVLPALAVLVRGCEALRDGEHFGIAHVLPELVRRWPAAVRVTVLPTACSLLAAAALRAWRDTGQTWALVSLGATSAATVTSVLVAVVALPYALRTGEPTRPTWLVSAYVVSRNPVPVLAVLSALGLAVWAAGHLSFALVLLLPAPLALVWVSALTTATRRSRTRLASRSAPTVR